MQRPWFVSCLLVLASGLLALTGVPAAHAHDQLLDSSPAHGERLTDPPDQILLEYSGVVLNIGAGLILVDSAGTHHDLGEPLFDGYFVSADLPAGLPAGGYEVRWRVVSSDGHPISGIIPFAIGDAEPGVPLDDPAEDARDPVAQTPATPAAEPPEAEGVPAADEALAATAPPSDAPSPWRPSVVAALGAIGALLIFLVIGALRPARMRQGATGAADLAASPVGDEAVTTDRKAQS